MVLLRYVILFTALQSLTLAWKMDREVGSDEPTRWYRPESWIRDSVETQSQAVIVASSHLSKSPRTWALGPGLWDLLCCSQSMVCDMCSEETQNQKKCALICRAAVPPKLP